MSYATPDELKTRIGASIYGELYLSGDVPAAGDLEAAAHNHARFFPINPGHESESWERFYMEAFALFLGGKYGGSYEKEIINEFQSCLSSVPPWEKTGTCSQKGLP